MNTTNVSIRPVVMAMLLAATGAVSAPVLAHGDQAHAGNAQALRLEQKPWGIAAPAKAATRTIEIRMSDRMRYSPDRIEVREGETVRLVHRNGGKLLHEFVLGTPEELAAHAELMKKFPTMEHDEPYMAHVPAGRRAEITWTFNRSGEFEFACLLPGHYEAGMVGKVIVKPR
ncbi:cupredoxin domain-containing protein [Leptothrix sp. BB-4]